EIILCIGGSATSEGGSGALTAMGAKFLDSNGKEILPSAETLQQISGIVTTSLPEAAFKAVFKIACDVKNPLLGPNGAARVYSPQKGASTEDVLVIEKGLEHYVSLLEKTCGKSVRDIPGSGAAGGFAISFLAFFNTGLLPGFKLVADLLKLEEQIKTADLVITGEGELSSQTMEGKVPWGVLQLAAKHNVPVVAFCGRRGEGVEQLEGFKDIICLLDSAASVADSIARAADLLEELSFNYAAKLQNKG
ncbi:MAG: glycerate kinase, partial [Candidatus Dadabacteria bacterium]